MIRAACRFLLFLFLGFSAHPLTCEEGCPRKVLFIMPKMLLGGSEQAFLSLTNGWSIPNTKVEILVVRRGGVLEPSLRKDFPLVSEEEAFCHQYDVAVDYMGMDPRPWLYKVHAKRKIVWVHTDLLKSPWGHPLMDKEVCKGIDAFICVSEKVAESARILQPWLSDRIFTIRNVLDGNLVKKKATEMGPCFPKDGLLTVVSVGRLSPEKAFDRAIKVHSRLDKKGISFRWYIVGEGDERPKLEKEIEECKLQRKFILLGAKMNPYPYIAQADIFVLPSLFEGCSIVVNEAKILKRPILVTDVGAAREQIVSERTGLIVDNKEKAIFEGLKRLLQNEALRKKFSRALSGFEYENESIYKQIEQVFFPEDKR